MKKNNKNRIALGILLGTIGIFGAGLYLRERDEVKKKNKKKVNNNTPKKEEVIAREDTSTEYADIKKLCISILQSNNPPENAEDFLRRLVVFGMGNQIGSEKYSILERMPKTVGELEDMISEFKMYREYARVCYSKLGKVEKENGVAIVVGKL